MRILHAADLHVGARPYQLDEIARVFEDSWLRLVEIALEERVDAVLIAGDVFDRPRPRNEHVALVARGIRRLVEKGVRVVAAHGEHDTPGRREMTVLELLESMIDGFAAPRPRGSGPDQVAASIVRIGDVDVAVYPMVKADPQARKKLARVLLPVYQRVLEARGARRRVFLAHIGLQEVMPCPFPDPESCPHDAALSQIPRVDYAALGHVHREWLSTGPVAAAYPGSAFPKDVSEARERFPRGALLVDLDGDEPSIQRVEYGVASYWAERVEIHGPMAVEREVAEAIRKAAARMPRAGRRVVFLETIVPPSVPLAAVERAAASASRRLGVVAAVRHRRLAVDASAAATGASVIGAGDLDPASVIALEFNLSRETAGLLLALRDALLSGAGEERVLEILDDLASRPDYKRLMDRLAGGVRLA